MPLLHRATVLSLSCLISVLTLASSSYAIPAFSRQYGTSCITCHIAITLLCDSGHRLVVQLCVTLPACLQNERSIYIPTCASPRCASGSRPIPTPKRSRTFPCMRRWNCFMLRACCRSASAAQVTGSTFSMLMPASVRLSAQSSKLPWRWA